MLYNIYKLENERTKETYYGSTSISLKQRYAQHKSINNPCTSKILFENPDDIINLSTIHTVKTDDKQLILNLERGCIEHDDNCINKNIPNRSVSEYKILFKDELKIKNKIYCRTWQNKNAEYFLNYREKNKEKIRLYQKEYRIKKKELNLTLNT